MTYSQARPAALDATGEELAAAETRKQAADRRFAAAQKLLGMRGFRSPVGQGNNPTGLFVRESTFEVVDRQSQPMVWRTPPTIVTLRLLGECPVPILSSSWHATFCSPSGREEEAEELTALVDKVQAKHGSTPGRAWAAFLGFGDCNEYPVPAGETVPEVDWSSPEITDLVHRRHRARRQPDGSWKSCTYFDEAMLDCGMWDPARYAAHELGQVSALDATAGHAAFGQGGSRRIDRGYMDPWTVQAVLEVNVVPTDGISDHHGLEVIVSRRKYEEGLRRSFASLDPWPLTHSM
ncbi:endonuclease/exonuclease/phosphatase family protein [Streptomyces albus]|uniref:endonuclease/exonuclease/phosphatase family protein n=1 Tax=Streptomyces albus TaxID=1888 RepID=UPI0037012627